jgi:UDP-N-acetylglucosamine:LPS N-acetylglucosamine transferase
VLISDAEAPEKAFGEALRLLDHSEEIKSLETNIQRLGRPGAADEIADIIIRIAKTGKR